MAAGLLGVNGLPALQTAQRDLEIVDDLVQSQHLCSVDKPALEQEQHQNLALLFYQLVLQV